VSWITIFCSVLVFVVLILERNNVVVERVVKTKYVVLDSSIMRTNSQLSNISVSRAYHIRYKKCQSEYLTGINYNITI